MMLEERYKDDRYKTSPGNKKFWLERIKKSQESHYQEKTNYMTNVFKSIERSPKQLWKRMRINWLTDQWKLLKDQEIK